MCIIGIMAIIYCGLNNSSKQAYGVRYWVSYPEIICRHSRQLSKQKYCRSLVMCAPPFRPTTPRKKVQSTIFAPLQVEHRGATEPHIQHKAYLTDAQPNNPSDSCSGHVHQTGAGPKHGELSCSHGTFLHVAPYVAQSHSAIKPPPPFITYLGTSPTPKSWQTTSHIRRRHPACGRRVRPERSCAGGTEWFRCLQQVLLQSFPRILWMGMT